ncbi:PREDICTED: collagenase-like [Papilio polytes]|uniref:collagenase-like n=1 Tax=Papilio polytes TaxID=76194 RepID=UPI00067673CB|nr:PREDICTED: collagenase-like [Papilio polytes]
MKLFLVVLCGVAALSARAAAEEPILQYYHDSAGVALAELIRQSEEAADFDGSRIAGGSLANLGAYPYLGGLVVTLNDGRTSVCGSTMLTNTRFVTAAHCWFDGRNNARQVTVVVGSATLFSGGTRVNTNNVQIHGSYNSATLHNDVAIIATWHIGYSNNIRNIGLASGTNQFAGTWAWAAGFGRTGNNAVIGNNQRLSHVQVQVITNAVCAQTYGPNAIIASTLCTSGAGGRGVCPGDSGGPLVANNQLIGVISFTAQRGCQAGMPSGYARVTSFRSWIVSRI